MCIDYRNKWNELQETSSKRIPMQFLTLAYLPNSSPFSHMPSSPKLCFKGEITDNILPTNGPVILLCYYLVQFSCNSFGAFQLRNQVVKKLTVTSVFALLSCTLKSKFCSSYFFLFIGIYTLICKYFYLQKYLSTRICSRYLEAEF